MLNLIRNTLSRIPNPDNLFWEYFKTARTFIFFYIFYILYSEDDLWLQIKNEMSWSGFEQEEETRYSSTLPSRNRMAGRRRFTAQNK